MHDRAARPTGAVKSAAAIAIETMILLNINLRIAQVRPRVEESVQRFPAPLVFLLPLAIGDYDYDYEDDICTSLALCNGSLVNRESFRGCDQYASCNLESSEKWFIRRAL